MTSRQEFNDGRGRPLLEAEWQLCGDEEGSEVLLFHWTKREKISRNEDLFKGQSLSAAQVTVGDKDLLFAQVRYRDQDLTWSPWSPMLQVTSGS